MRSSFHWHRTILQAGWRPRTHNARLAAAWLRCGREARAEESERRQTDLDSRHASYLPAASYTKRIRSRNREGSRLGCYRKCKNLLNTCQITFSFFLSFLFFPVSPFSTLNHNSPSGLTLCVFHWETGKRRRKWRRTWIKKKEAGGIFLRGGGVRWSVSLQENRVWPSLRIEHSWKWNSSPCKWRCMSSIVLWYVWVESVGLWSLINHVLLHIKM